MADKNPKRLFCWSGGGLPGLDIHCGIWLALESAGIRADGNAGTSAGAMVGAMNSAGYLPARVETMLRSLRDGDVIRHRRFWKLRMNSAPSILDNSPVLDLCRRLLPPTFNGLHTPLTVHATNDTTGAPAEIASGSLPLCVAASMALSGIWPPVNIEDPNGRDGRAYSDGGTTDNLPLPQRMGEYDEIWLLVAKRPLAYPRRQTILSRLLWNADLMLEAQVRQALSTARRIHPVVRLIRPDAESPRGTLHFDHDLIDRAFADATRQLNRIMEAADGR